MTYARTSQHPESTAYDGKHVKVAVDIGGTFTDIVVMLPDGFVHQSKVPTSTVDPSIAVVEGVRDLLERLQVEPAWVREVLHGTTVGSNTILQKSGSRTGLITTRGFRDVLEIGRVRVPDMFDLFWKKPEPLVPRRYRVEVAERIDAHGQVVVPLDEAGIRSAVHSLVGSGVTSIAIAFLNSFRNPDHEARAEAVVREEYPALDVTCSYDVLPEIKEYERTSTTVVNAYLLASMRGYIERLASGLRDIGVQAPLFIMTSSGGMLTSDVASTRPVFLVASGPAGGVIGAAKLSQARKDPAVVVFDMGGTTAKAVLVENGRPHMTSEYEFREGLSTSSRFMKAGGYMLKVPAIDIAEVGAGGGSIAFVDEGGLLCVGPVSAGSTPGPACYGLGNDRPTVTDANVVLGLINPSALAGGSLRIDRDKSEAAIREHVATPLGLTIEEAAIGIRQVANMAMARAIRAITVERGLDPRRMTLVAMGGNGGGHASDVARELGIAKIVVPPFSGVFASLGMLASDVSHFLSRMVIARLDEAAADTVGTTIRDLQAEAGRLLAKDGFSREDIVFEASAEIRYEGQATELTVDVDPAELSSARLRTSFENAYRATYGYLDDSPIEIMKLGLVARGLRRNSVDFSDFRHAVRAAAESAGERRVTFLGETERARMTPVLRRADLGARAALGPIIIEEFDATIVVPPTGSVRLDELGNVEMTLEGVS